MSRPTPAAYKTWSWPAYNEALKRRGSLTIWFDPYMIWEAASTGKRGRQLDYSGEEDQKTARGTVFPTNAIQTCLTMKVLFGMALRQTTGFVESLLRLIDLDWVVPNVSTLSRRQSGMGPWPQCGRVSPLNPEGQHRGSQGPLHLLIDSTGIKVEGEWSEEGQKTIRGIVFPTNAQARRHETPRSPLFLDKWRTRLAAQDPHRN